MPNSHKAWLAYCSDNLRRMNRKNMKLIGISEEEVLAFFSLVGFCYPLSDVIVGF